jgi:beta-lactamase regulating signal transducer with metallopeptidase domain
MTDLLLDLLVRVTGVLALAAIVIAALRRSSASVRALAWTAALTGALVLPPIALFAPAIEVGVLPARTSTESGVQSPSPKSTQASLPPEVGRPTAEQTSQRQAELSATPFSESSVASATTPPTPRTNDATSQAPAMRVPLMPGLPLGLWAVGALLVIARLLRSHARLHRLVRSATRASSEWQSRADAIRAELGIRRHVEVRTSSEIQVPAVAGVLVPVLLLPESAEWSAEVRRDVVLHELAHVARWDALSQLLSQLACAAYWFIPFAWYGARRAAALREQACDNVVLNAGTRPSVYAERLLTFARTPMLSELEPVALAMARPARIHGRVLGILDPRARRTRLSASATGALVVLALAAVALVAVVEPVEASQAIPVPDREAPPALPVQDDPRPAPAVPTSDDAPPLPAIDTPPQARASAICRRGVESNSTHRNSDDGNETWRMTAKGPGCEVTIRAEGKPTFNAEFTDIVRIDGRGRFELDVSQDGVRRELRLRDEGGRITRTWRVDGRERPYDAEAAAWFSRILIEIDRQTAFALDVRLPRLLQNGGVGAVLDETRQMPSDYARSAYHTALAKERRLTPQELSRLLDQEAELSTSDYHAAELLKGIARQGLGDARVRGGVMRLISGMKSDFHKSESIKATVVAGRPSDDEVDLLFRVVGTMESDFHKSETVKLLAETSDLSTEQLGVVLVVVGGMESDFHINEMLATLLRRGTLDPTKRRVYLNAARSMESDFHLAESLKGLLANGPPTAEEMDLLQAAITDVKSDHHKGEVLGRLLAARTLREADLLLAERTARTIESDHTRAEALRRIGGHPAATAAVRDAVYAAASGLSSHYRDEVRRAVGR